MSDLDLESYVVDLDLDEWGSENPFMDEFGASDMKSLLDEWVVPEGVSDVAHIGMLPVYPKGFKNASTPKRAITEEDKTAMKRIRTVNERGMTEDDLNALNRIISSNLHTQMNANDILTAIGMAQGRDVVMLSNLVRQRVWGAGIDDKDKYTAVKLYLLQSPFWVLYVKRLPFLTQYAFSLFLGRTNAARRLLVNTKYTIDHDMDRLIIRLQLSRNKQTVNSKAPPEAGMPPGALNYDYNLAKYAFGGLPMLYMCLITPTYQVRFFITKNVDRLNPEVYTPNWSDDFARPLNRLMTNIFTIVPDSNVGYTAGSYPTTDAPKDMVTASYKSNHFKVEHIAEGLLKIAKKENPNACILYIKQLVLHAGTPVEYMDLLRRFNAGIVPQIGKTQ